LRSKAQSWRRDRFAIIFLVALAAALIRLWVQPLDNSFWLDETLIVWTVRDGLQQVIPHAFISLQSVAFCLLEGLAAQAGGVSELSLRLAPVLAGIGTLYVFYRIGAEALDRELGLILAALFAALPSVAVEVSTARPYALALFAHSAALLWLLRWLRSGRLRDGIWWAVCAALACHFHHLFAITVPVEAGAALWMAHKRSGINLREPAVCGVLVAILLLPAMPQALAIRKLGSLLSFAPKPSAVSLFAALIPLGVILVAGLLAAVARAAGGISIWTKPKSGADAAILGASLLVLVVAGFFAVSRLTEIRLFESRYLLPAAPGFVLFWGWLLRGLGPARLRRMSLIAVVVSSVFWTAGFSRGVDYRHEDWRSAVRSMPNTGAVLVYTGLVETRRLDWLQSRERWGHLTAPVAVYRPSISPDNTFLIPFSPGPSEAAYIDRLMVSISNRETITIIARRFSTGHEWISWLSRRLVNAGFEAKGGSVYGTVEVRTFRRL
jgi:4-amino-4-deoxy-L-arabinose transferase-like glycosyltransferase